ncbi:hypothetical protein CXG81DRAFT_13860, partial [Caulochytrium protostelioides]
MEVDVDDDSTAATAVSNAPLTLPDRGVRLLLPPPDTSGPPLASRIVLPPDFFTLSSTEVKALMGSLAARRQQTDNRPLMTRALREREAALKAQRYPKTVLRIRLPDRSVIEAQFLSSER